MFKDNKITVHHRYLLLFFMIKKPLYKLLLFAVILFASCEKLVDDPLSEQEKLDLMEVFLSQAQIQLAQTAGHDHAIYSSLFTQQIAGTHGKTMRIERYDITARDTDEAWINWYAGVMSLLKTVKTTADETDQKKYGGISRVLIALAGSHLTDVWGDIPFSSSILQDTPSNFPAYDTQQEVYEHIFALLDDAENLLQQAANFPFPNIDDHLFQGNTNAWIDFISFLRMRFHLNLSNQNGFDVFTELPAELPSWDIGHRVAIAFEEHEFADHPVYIYQSLDHGGLRAGHSLVDLMSDNDPRKEKYFRKNNNDSIAGSVAGEGDLMASRLTSLFTSADAAIVLGSYTEWMFMKAEVSYQQGHFEEARENLRMAMSSSSMEFGILNVSWVDEYLESVTFDLETILSQKYIALFLQPQSFNDWRRTGYPVLQPATGNVTNDKLPRRFPYPENEIQYNSDNLPDNIPLWSPVWWENEPL